MKYKYHYLYLFTWLCCFQHVYGGLELWTDGNLRTNITPRTSLYMNQQLAIQDRIVGLLVEAVMTRWVKPLHVELGGQLRYYSRHSTPHWRHEFWPAIISQQYFNLGKLSMFAREKITYRVGKNRYNAFAQAMLGLNIIRLKYGTLYTAHEIMFNYNKNKKFDLYDGSIGVAGNIGRSFAWHAYYLYYTLQEFKGPWLHQHVIGIGMTISF